MSSIVALWFMASLQVSAQINSERPEIVGNCFSQTISFSEKERIFALDGIDSNRFIDELDVSRYDLTIDYFTKQVSFPQDGGVQLKISAGTGANPDAPRLSTTRYMRYGKISAIIRAPAVPGIVTTFVTMGPQISDPAGVKATAPLDKMSGDEIDWEILGKAPMEAQSNIFFRGIKEFSARGGVHAVSSIEEEHLYEIDWRHDSIIFSIDGKVQREYKKSSQEADSPYLNEGTKFFPDRAGKIAFAVWSEASNSWAGGAPQWPNAAKEAFATYKNLKIQCYDDNDNPVPRWPLTNNPGKRETVPGQPTQGAGGKIPAAAGVGGSSGTFDLGISGSNETTTTSTPISAEPSATQTSADKAKCSATALTWLAILTLLF